MVYFHLYHFDPASESALVSNDALFSCIHWQQHNGGEFVPDDLSGEGIPLLRAIEPLLCDLVNGRKVNTNFG